MRALADDIRTHQGESEQLLDGTQTLKQVTDSTLSLMLQRAKEQRRIRNTLSVLSRFRPVFEITTKMKESLASRNYEKLADDYCRLKHHTAKANISVLHRVFTAAHEIAQTANTELLKHFDDVSLSVAEQVHTREQILLAKFSTTRSSTHWLRLLVDVRNARSPS